MPFHPAAKATIQIDGTSYTVAEHPTAPGLPYGQEGRAGTVYQLLSPAGTKALKVFKPRFSTPSLVMQANAIAPFSSLLGLKVCQLNVLSPSREGALLRQYPDLTYSLLMPWIEGMTWFDVVNSRKEFSEIESLELAQKLTSILVGLEEHGLAHCDLSSSNLIFSKTDQEISLELIDIDGMFGPGFPKPEIVLSGSPGYAHTSIQNGSWNSQSDRFAGAVLIAEMLGWSSPDVRKAANDGCYFSAGEIQKDCPHYQLLVGYLKNTFGESIADNFSAAWHSETLNDCPTFGKWLVSLPDQPISIPLPAEIAQPAKEPTPKASAPDAISMLIAVANELENQNKNESALEVYRQALRITDKDNSRLEEIQSRICLLERSGLPAEEPTPNLDPQEIKADDPEPVADTRLILALQRARNKEKKGLIESALEEYQQALVFAEGASNLDQISEIKQVIEKLKKTLQTKPATVLAAPKTDVSKTMDQYKVVDSADDEEDDLDTGNKAAAKLALIIIGIICFIIGLGIFSQDTGPGVFAIFLGILLFIIGLVYDPNS